MSPHSLMADDVLPANAIGYRIIHRAADTAMQTAHRLGLVHAAVLVSRPDPFDDKSRNNDIATGLLGNARTPLVGPEGPVM